MGLAERRAIYAEIESHRKRPLLVYVTSKRPGVYASMATDALPYLIDQIERLPTEAEELDFLIVSFGGDPMVAWRIVTLLRQRVKKLSVLIPHSAFSAATLLALGADEIVMHPYSHLGPVDMQITTFSEGRPRQFSTEDISAFIGFVKEELSITDQRHLRRLFQETCREVGTLGVGFTARSSKLAFSLGEKLLGLHMGEADTKPKHRSLIENLSRQFHSHAYPVSRDEAIEIGLAVTKTRDPALEGMMWRAWLELEQELQEREPFSPMAELLRSTAAAQLLAPVPQLSLPANAQLSYSQADLAAVKAEIQPVEPVDFRYIDAVIESPRLADACTTNGKILASRQPDLSVNYSVLVTSRAWTRTP